MKYLIDNELILDEPFCSLDNAEKLKNWSKDDEINWNQTHRQTDKYKFYIRAFDFLTDNKIGGDYFEFGCHRARTFRMAITEARHHNLDKMNFLAFDSFEGLPTNDGDHGIGNKWDAGQLTTTQDNFLNLIKDHGIYIDNVKLFPGFYQQSLNQELTKKIRKLYNPASFICIDCDLYESAVPVFKFIDDFIQEGTIIYLDDYWVGYKGNPNKGVSKAFKEFRGFSKFKFEPYLNIGWLGKSFIAYL